MKHRKFNHQDYLRDLEKVEENLERVRTQKGSVSTYKRSTSQKGPNKHSVPLRTVTKDFQNRLNETPANPRNNPDLLKTKVKAEWAPRDSGVQRIGESTRNSKRFVKEQRHTQNGAVAVVPKEQAQLTRQSGVEQEARFMEQTCRLYHLDSNVKLQRLVTQIQARDRVFDVVEGLFPNSNPQSYETLLSEYFANEKVLLRIIEQFKTMSRVDIDDLSQLHHFLQEE